MTPGEVEDVVVTLDEALDALDSSVKRLTEYLVELQDSLTALDTRARERLEDVAGGLASPELGGTMLAMMKDMLGLLQKMEPYCPVTIQDESRALRRAAEALECLHTWDVACRSGAVVPGEGGVSKTIHTTIWRCRECGVERGETK
jgi:hypothetical protein